MSIILQKDKSGDVDYTTACIIGTTLLKVVLSKYPEGQVHSEVEADVDKLFKHYHSEANKQKLSSDLGNIINGIIADGNNYQLYKSLEVYVYDLPEEYSNTCTAFINYILATLNSLKNNTYTHLPSIAFNEQNIVLGHSKDLYLYVKPERPTFNVILNYYPPENTDILNYLSDVAGMVIPLWSTKHYHTLMHTAKAILSSKHVLSPDYTDSPYSKNTIRQLLARCRDIADKNSSLFFKMLYLAGEDELAIEHLFLSPEDRTIGSKKAYLSSWFFKEDIVALEDIDDEMGEDSDTDDDDDIGNEDDPDKEDEGTESEDEEPEDDDDEESDPDEDDSESDEEDVDGDDASMTDDTDDADTPSIMPEDFTMAIIESPESMAGFIFKLQVCDLVNRYKVNPPDFLSAEELLLLRQLVDQWIFLGSASLAKIILTKLRIDTSSFIDIEDPSENTEEDDDES